MRLDYHDYLGNKSYLQHQLNNIQRNLTFRNSYIDSMVGNVGKGSTNQDLKFDEFNKALSSKDLLDLLSHRNDLAYKARNTAFVGSAIAHAVRLLPSPYVGFKRMLMSSFTRGINRGYLRGIKMHSVFSQL